MMNKTTYTIAAVATLAALALGLTGCERFLQVPVAEDEIVFRSEGLAPGTKAAAVSSLESFYVSAVTGSAGADVQAWTSTTFSQVGTSGDYRGGKIWPGSDPSYRFYASNVVMSYAAGGPTVAATNATDVVCAYLPSPTFHETNALTFKHIFSRLGAVTVSADNKYTISDIMIWIRDLKTGGTYNLYTGAGHTDGMGWSSLTPAASSDTQVFRYAGSLDPSASQTGSDNALWFVPGNYSLVASWTAHVNDYTGAYVQVTSSAAVAFAAGEENTLSVTLSGDEIRVTLTPLGDQLAWGSGALLRDPVEWMTRACWFSVAVDRQVEFSPGNLQYQATTNTWRFAANQWTYIGNAAGNTSPSSSQSNWIDLFGWGTSGVSGYSPIATYYEPWRTIETDNSKYNPYGSMSTNLYDGGANAGKADWGYNFINNNGSLETGWRTLTTDEWLYLFDTRTGDKASTIGSTVNVRYAEGTITGTVSGNINGVFLFPDGGTFATSEFTTVGTLNAASDWTMKVTATQWVALEAKGCAFLPAAGTRYGTSVDNAGSYGLYWTSSFYDTSHHAWSVSFQSDNVTPQNWSGRGRGCSVRLVR